MKALALVVLCLSVAVPVRAAPGAVRLTLEPGASTLEPLGAERAWGVAGGLAVALGLTELVWAQILLSRGSLSSSPSGERLTVLAGTLVYTIDVLEVTPFVELGLGRAQLDFQGDSGLVSFAETTPILAAGFDVAATTWLWLGASARYYPILGTALFASPAYSTLQVRLSVCTSCP